MCTPAHLSTMLWQVVLDGKVLAVMAPTKQEKQMWVDGLNAIVEGLLQPLS